MPTVRGCHSTTHIQNFKAGKTWQYNEMDASPEIMPLHPVIEMYTDCRL